MRIQSKKSGLWRIFTDIACSALFLRKKSCLRRIVSQDFFVCGESSQCIVRFTDSLVLKMIQIQILSDITRLYVT